MKLTVLVDNNTYIDQYYCGEPAAAYYLEDGDSRILWDCGYSDIILRNAQALDIDLSQLTDIAISHGHDDHTRGLRTLAEAYDLSLVTMTAHPQAFAPKRTADGQLIGSPYTASELAQRCQLRLSAEPIKLSPRITFLGEIPRTSPIGWLMIRPLSTKAPRVFISSPPAPTAASATSANTPSRSLAKRAS